MKPTEYSQSVFDDAAVQLGDQGPVYMVNLVRYRAEAHYSSGTDEQPCSGREAYFERYAPAFNTVAQGEDYSVSWVGKVHGVLVGATGEKWDDIVIVRYVSLSALRRILESPEYETHAAPHRRAALADWKFIVTTQPVLTQ